MGGWVDECMDGWVEGWMEEEIRASFIFSVC